jgi:hypothetical protein
MAAALPAPGWEQLQATEEAERVQVEAARMMREAAGVRPDLAPALDGLARALEADTKMRAETKGGEASARINGKPF